MSNLPYQKKRRYISTLRGTQNFEFVFKSTYVYFNAEINGANENWCK
jgi:hypothetical protein